MDKPRDKMSVEVEDFHISNGRTPASSKY